MKKIIAVLLAAVLAFSLILLLKNNSSANDDDIVILFTTDIHGAVDENMSMSNIAYLKKYLQTKTPYVTLVDCGDAFQGSYMGSVSKGQVIVDLMNMADYDFFVYGNHDFDFGMERLHELTDGLNAHVLCCNITYSGSGVSGVEKSSPYEIVKYGNRSVAYIGVTTPTTPATSTSTFFKENGEYVYDFCQGEEGKKLYDSVQKNVDEAKKQGADYVIVLSHLGIDDQLYSSTALAENTYGVDAIIDGHSHLTFERIETNSKGEPVYIAQAGTKLAEIGQLTISESGLITVSVMDNIAGVDIDTDDKQTQIKEIYTKQLSEVVASSKESMPITDQNGIRAIRNQEMAIGSLVADSMRTLLNADIGYVNGGAIREGLPSGEIKKLDIINVLPFGNKVDSIEVTGQEVLDILEFFSRYIDKETEDVENNRAKWEDGNFPHVSGLKFTVDTSIPSSVVVDEHDMFIKVEEGKQRRVSDVFVLQDDNTYAPIDTAKTYTIASHDYFCKNGGCGMELFLKDHKIVQNDLMEDYMCLITYIQDELQGDISEYYNFERHITIK